MPNRRQSHPHPHLLVPITRVYPSTKPGAVGKHIILYGKFHRHEWYLHATKGWRRRTA